LRQRQIVDELERHGRGHSETARLARDLLQLFEMTLSAHIADRMHLTLALQELAGAEVGGKVAQT
jgi:predicted ribonuclease YlaK